MNGKFLIAGAFFITGVSACFGQGIVTCSSNDGKRHYCDADTRYGVKLGKQRSGSPCVEGSTWGYDDRGVWVDRGCRADLIVLSDSADPRPDDSRYDRRRIDDFSGSRRRTDRDSLDGKIVYCASDDGRRHYCDAETRSGVSMAGQRSESQCIRDETWGVDGRGLWVDRRCRADFRLEGVAANNREHPDSRVRGYEGNDGACSIAAGDREASRMVRQCMEVSTATHPPCNAQNSCRTIIQEIRRGCDGLGRRAPSFCRDY